MDNRQSSNCSHPCQLSIAYSMSFSYARFDFAQRFLPGPFDYAQGPTLIAN